MSAPQIDPARREALLAVLPEKVAATIRAVMDNPGASYNDRMALVKEAMEGVAFPAYANGIPLPKELSPFQRAIAELLACSPKQPLHRFAIPIDTWNLRRWLGIDPPGVLERPLPGDEGPDAVPAWRQLVRADRGAAAAKLGFAERLEVLCELSLGAYRVGFDLRGDELISLEELSQLGDQGKERAPRLADDVLAILDGPDWFNGRGFVPIGTRWALFVALVRAQIPIEPRWDCLLPIDVSRQRRPLCLECINALPRERRGEAVANALARELPTYECDWALDLLPDVPDAAVVHAIREAVAAGGTRPRGIVMAELEELAKKSEAIRAVVGTERPRKTLKLTLRVVEKPADPSMLTPLQREQLKSVLAQKEERYEVTELFTVHGARGKHLYDMVLVGGDDGPVFKCGTSEWIASFCQGSADTQDEKLREALDLALHNHKVPRKPAPGTVSGLRPSAAGPREAAVRQGRGDEP